MAERGPYDEGMKDTGAKLGGLAAKEVGSCQRALGGVLGWRLWVGKDYDGVSVSGIDLLAPRITGKRGQECVLQ